MPTLAPGMGCQGTSSPFTDHSHHRVPQRTLVTTPAPSPWPKSVSSEPAWHQPHQMGQIRDRSRIPRPRSVPGKGRWLRTPHITQSSFPSCLYPPVTPSIEPQPMAPHSLSSSVRHTAPPLPHRTADPGSHPSTAPPPCQEKLTPLPQAPAPLDVSLDDSTASTTEGPTLADNTPSGHEPPEVPPSGTVLVPVPQVPPALLPESSSPLPAPPRPCRERRPPKRFQPETGTWVQH